MGETKLWLTTEISSFLITQSAKTSVFISRNLNCPISSSPSLGQYCSHFCWNIVLKQLIISVLKKLVQFFLLYCKTENTHVLKVLYGQEFDGGFKMNTIFYSNLIARNIFLKLLLNINGQMYVTNSLFFLAFGKFWPVL